MPKSDGPIPDGLIRLYRNRDDQKELIIEFNLVSKRIKLFSDLNMATHCLWDYILTISRKRNSSIVSFNYGNKPIISFDIESGRIMHDFWDPSMSFILSELERRNVG